MREHYLGGREHAAIKHFFLKQYLEALAFKTLQAQRPASRAFAYIDGFTGPWETKDDESYSDTSFGVALNVLKRVSIRLGDVQIKCVFCETRRRSYRDLQDYVSKNAGPIEVRCVHGRFEENIPEILQFIGQRGFLFAFIDPKGWNVDVEAITPLLRDTWSEVLFTFMAEFISRFPDFDKVRRSYAALLGDVDWRARFESLPYYLSNDDKILILFRQLLKERWRFSHVLELPIRKLSRDRIFYKLVYGTRSPHGVLAFREAQAKAEKEGFAVAVEAELSPQMSLFSPDEQAEQLAAAVGVGNTEHLAQLPEAIIERLRSIRQGTFLKIAADVLEVIPAREKDVKMAVEALSNQGRISLSNSDKSSRVTRKSIISLVH